MTCALQLGVGIPLPLFPLLVHPRVQGAPGRLARPLFVGPKLSDIPVVTLVHFMSSDPWTASRAFANEQRLTALGKKASDLEAEALHNVTQRPASWDTSALLSAGMLSCHDDYLAAERILDPTFLGLAGRLLGEDSIVLGIPMRGQLHATGFSRLTKDPRHALAFTTTLRRIFEQAGEPAISPWPYLVIGGRLNSILETSG